MVMWKFFFDIENKEVLSFSFDNIDEISETRKFQDSFLDFLVQEKLSCPVCKSLYDNETLKFSFYFILQILSDSKQKIELKADFIQCSNCEYLNEQINVQYNFPVKFVNGKVSEYLEWLFDVPLVNSDKKTFIVNEIFQDEIYLLNDCIIYLKPNDFVETRIDLGTLSSPEDIDVVIYNRDGDIVFDGIGADEIKNYSIIVNENNKIEYVGDDIIVDIEKFFA